MKTLDEEIGRRLREAADSGELGSAPSYGKPLEADPGWDATPDALRMSMKILKDAGAVPPEIEMFQERVRLKAQIAATADDAARKALEIKLSLLEQNLALRLEALRLYANL
jgi:hypothetical protein